MKTPRLPIVLLCVCLPLGVGALTTGCDDATNVGEDLVGAQGGHPETVEIPIGTLESGELLLPPDLPSRVLAGMVDDPTLGAYHVEGYFDLTPVTSEPFRAQPVEHVELRLRPSYVYGDTTSEITLALREVTEDWEPSGLPTDTSFSVGPVLLEFSFVSTDTLVVVSLPESWVEDHVDAFQSPDIGELFHGFRLDPVAGNAVVGFGPESTSLLATTADESLASPIGAAYADVDRTASGTLPPDRFLMQAGAGPIPVFSLLGGGPDVPSSSVNRATVTFWADTTSVHAVTPEHFVRPTLRTLDLYAVTQDGSYTLLARTTINNEGQFEFDTQILARAYQEMLVGSQDFERFEILLPDPNTLASPQGETPYLYSSLNPVVLFGPDAGTRSPTGFLTITPLD